MGISKIEYLGETYAVDVARNLMDDELCDKIHGTVDTDQEFFDAYVIAHAEKFGAALVIN